MRDSHGKTQVHDNNCPYLGEKKQECGCPLRLACGTVASVISQLKTIFDDCGRTGDWVESGLLKYGNPVSSNIVSQYLKAVKLEQAKAHVLIKQATPLFLDKLKLVSVHIETSLTEGPLSFCRRFVLLRDRAFFTLQFFAGDRASDLSQCMAQEVKALPEGKGLFFRHTIGKTLGNGKVNEFVISPVKDKSLCPVENLNIYVTEVEKMGVDLSVGFLFRALDPSHSKVIESPVSSSGMTLRLQSYLKDLSVFDGETIHGIRGGCAITLMSKGIANPEEVMQHVGWFNKSSLDRYSRMGKMVDSSSLSQLFANTADSRLSETSSIFKKFGDFSKLPKAF